MLNNCTLAGRLSRDVEVKNGVVKFSVAVKRKFAKQGQQDTDFFNVTCFSKTGEFVQKYFKKGDAIGLVGEVHIDKVEDKYYTNFIAESVYFVGGKQGAGATGANNTSAGNDTDDDMPF